MDKRRMTWLTLGFGVLVLLVVGLLAYGSRRSPEGIVLPEAPGDVSGVSEDGGDSQLNVIAVSPETVQTAISTLSRPASYSRAQMVETFWSGGSGQSVSQIYVSGGRSRLDSQLADGSVRHTLISEGRAGVWYDDEKEWKLLQAEALTADLAGRTLSYEAVLELPADRIIAADYREREGVYCIYVETSADEAGYASRYWVSVESGLLCAAERTCGEELVYRFTAGQPETEPPEEGLFQLPDGSKLEEQP